MADEASFPSDIFMKDPTPSPVNDPSENAPETILKVIYERILDIAREMPQTWVAGMKPEQMKIVLTTKQPNDKARAIQHLHYEIIRKGPGVYLGFTSAVSYRQLGFITQEQALGLSELLGTKKDMAVFKSKPVLEKCKEFGIFELYSR